MDPGVTAAGPQRPTRCDSVRDRRDLQLRWFDYWLKGIDTGITKQAPLQLFVMGANRWLDAESWPVAETRYTRYYLRASQRQPSSSLNDGRLMRQAPGTNEKADAYIHDPYNPVPTIGGYGPHRPSWTPGPADQRPAEARSLTFTTAPLEKDLLVIGEVRVRFFASSSAADTDFFLMLTDVYPNEYSAGTLIQSGLGAMYSVGAPLKPGEVYEFKVNLKPTANLFKAGHRIRLNIASSSFPRFLPNPGTGEPRHLATKCVTAENKVYHDSRYPSVIELPVPDPQSVPYRPTAEMTSPVKDYFDSAESIPLEAQA
ncbi:MAG: CocE/NonD family hydrolase, partial [Planctomycetota bacterium]